MADLGARLELPHTAPRPLRDAVRRAEGPDPEQRVTVTVVVRSRQGEDALAEALDAVRRRLPHERPVLGHEEHARRFGSLQEDLGAVQAFAAEHGLEAVEVSPARHVVVLAGPLAAFARAFGVRFHLFDHPERPFRSHEGPVTIPRGLRGIVEDVIGLDDRPLARPRAAGGTAGTAGTTGTLETLVHTDPRTLARYYQFPEGLTGAGQCVAVLQFGGGYYASDMEEYFRLRGLPLPAMELVELGGQTSQPGSPEMMRAYAAKIGLIPAEAGDSSVTTDAGTFWATVECTMDLQILGTLAPEARFVTYLSPGTPQGKYDAFSRAIYDSQRSPSVINCSWGSCENQTPSSLLRSLDRLFQEAAVKGVTICASAGDAGDGASKCGEPSVNCPADSPYVLACGGSGVAADLSKETSWYEDLSGFVMSGGGGYSAAYGMPDWQKEGIGGAGGHSGRALPDVAAKADVMAGYDVVVTGLDLPMGGSSAAAPMWAGLTALINQKLGKPAGFFASHLYSKDLAGAVRDITESGGGPCKTGPGWDVCTGLGSPVGTGLLAALSGSK